MRGDEIPEAIYIKFITLIDIRDIITEANFGAIGQWVCGAGV